MKAARQINTALMSEEKFKNAERTEEVQTIIDRMPANFGIRITIILAFFISTLSVLGWVIRYPDIVSGQVNINADNVPIKLVANMSGKLWINNFNSKDQVLIDEYIGIIQNTAKLEDVIKIKKIITEFNINSLHASKSKIEFPKSVSLGELSEKYFAFLNAYKQYINFYNDNLLSKQKEILEKLLIEQENVLCTSGDKLKICVENLRLSGKFFRRDSSLFRGKVLAEADFDRTVLSYLTSKDNYLTQINNITTIREQIQETGNKIQQNEIQKREQQKQTDQDLAAAYAALMDNFKLWEQKYVFKAPINGQVQFLNFLTNDQFIQQGDAVFTIVPKRKKTVGQMMLPATGAGKVKVGQKVIIKLENYPYLEYGTVAGIVSSISLTTNTYKTDKGIVETYLINVTLPDDLKTNYGSNLDFQFEIKGTGEIITKKRRLVERLFDNLKYIQSQ